MIDPTQPLNWLAHVAHAPTWTGWHTMQALTQGTPTW